MRGRAAPRRACGCVARAKRAGMRYVAIFKTNRGAIKNPNLIHPEQQVNVPEE